MIERSKRFKAVFGSGESFVQLNGEIIFLRVEQSLSDLVAKSSAFW